MDGKYIQELIRKYADGTADEEEIQKLLDWYHSASIGEVHWLASDPAEKQLVHARMLHRLRNEIAQKRAGIIGVSWIRVAAMLLVITGAAFISFYFSKHFSKSFITVTNPTGQIQLVRLPDSSSVWLNALSTLRYRKTFKETRELELEGEGYFDVTHNAKHPFIVKAGDLKVTDLGTSFNIKAYLSENAIAVSLIRGSVKVVNDSKELAVLIPSMQLEYNSQSQVSNIASIDTNAVLAWKKGRLQFQGKTLADIVTTLERWYGVKIIFLNPGMRNCRYYMSFDNSTSLEILLSRMSEITAMQYNFDKNKKTITLSGRECH